MNYDIKKSGERIRQLRIENSLTQERAASVLNIDRSFYNRIEAGKKGCSIDLLVQISDLFHVSLDYLVLGRYSTDLILDADRTQIKSDIAKLAAQLEQFKAKL
ncbi:MAG: helix-turn-helix domain-containing protein [Oscillospiraceae bacterium]|nr:helix-turn-helix domain-containing protein [Oscillospiraceae bacterium]